MTSGVAEETVRKRILVFEDEPDIVRGLRDALKFEGFEVQSRGTGAEGLAAAMDWEPDAILLDLMLPDDNGYRVCETLRQRNETVPIIILTAKQQESDKIRGLDAGADDYVTKPFSVAELIARCALVYRRSTATRRRSDRARSRKHHRYAARSVVRARRTARASRLGFGPSPPA